MTIILSRRFCVTFLLTFDVYIWLVVAYRIAGG